MNSSRLRKVNIDYLEMVEGHFASERREFERSGLPLDGFLARDPLGLKSGLVVAGLKQQTSAEYKAESFRDDIRRFWVEHEAEVLDAVAASPGMSVCTWGDTELPESARRYAVYFDSVFVSDVIASFAAPEAQGRSAALYADQYFAWTLIVTQLRNLLLADTDPLPLALFPQRFGLHVEDTDERAVADQLTRQAEFLSFLHLSDVLQLPSSDSTLDSLFLSAFEALDDTLARRLAASDVASMVIATFGAKEILPTLRETAAEGVVDRLTQGQVGRRDLPFLFGIVKTQHFMSLMRESNAERLGADCALSDLMWATVDSRNRLLARVLNQKASLEGGAFVATAFQHGFQWLDGLSDDDILLAREDQGLSSIREALSVDHRALKRLSPADFALFVKDYERSVVDRLEAFGRRLQESRREGVRRRNRSLAAFGVAATLGVAAAAFPAAAALSALATVYGIVVGGPSVLDLVRDAKSRQTSGAKAENRPIAMLLEAHRRFADAGCK